MFTVCQPVYVSEESTLGVDQHSVLTSCEHSVDGFSTLFLSVHTSAKARLTSVAIRIRIATRI